MLVTTEMAPVGHIVNISLQVAEHGGPQTHFFYKTSFVGNIYDITNPDLVFKENKNHL